MTKKVNWLVHARDKYNPKDKLSIPLRDKLTYDEARAVGERFVKIPNKGGKHYEVFDITEFHPEIESTLTDKNTPEVTLTDNQRRMMDEDRRRNMENRF